MSSITHTHTHTHTTSVRVCVNMQIGADFQHTMVLTVHTYSINPETFRLACVVNQSGDDMVYRINTHRFRHRTTL